MRSTIVHGSTVSAGSRTKKAKNRTAERARNGAVVSDLFFCEPCFAKLGAIEEYTDPPGLYDAIRECTGCGATPCHHVPARQAHLIIRRLLTVEPSRSRDARGFPLSQSGHAIEAVCAACQCPLITMCGDDEDQLFMHDCDCLYHGP